MLKSRGLRVEVVKFDPDLTVDPGTMSPFQHGEVFVTVDGRETDLDLGHYERFMDIELSSNSNVTAGQIYRNLIDSERKGSYLGGTIQTVPHVTDRIKEHIAKVAKASNADVVLIEVGGTVGDIEGQPFLEAMRQLRLDPKIAKVCYVHLTLLPTIGGGEMKTKPTQHSVQLLRSTGIQPNIILCRADDEVPLQARKKVALYSDVPLESVIGLPTMGNVYDIPAYLEKQGVGKSIVDLLELDPKRSELDTWSRAVAPPPGPKGEVVVAMVGKYVDLPDSYLSVTESLSHAATALGLDLRVDWVDSGKLTPGNVARRLRAASGILVPGGFGERGVEGIITAVRHAREYGIPYLGLCLGMQVMVIEFARNVLELEQANSIEFDPDTPHAVIDLMPDQKGVGATGGTMRLGSWDCRLAPDTVTQRIYNNRGRIIKERHRHRYEVNNDYVEALQGHFRQI